MNPLADDRQRFVLLVRQYDPLLMRICSVYGGDLSNPSADLYQEILCHLWEKREQLFAAEYPTAWLFRVATRVAVSQHRKHRSHDKTFVRVEESDAVGGATDEKQVEDLRHLEELMNQLTEKERGWVMLYLEGYSYEEMSRILRVPVSTVGTRINRLKNKLKQLHNQI